MFKEYFLAFLSVFGITIGLCFSPNPTPQPYDYEKALMNLKQQEADMKVIEVRETYSKMSDEALVRGDAEAYRNNKFGN